MLTEIGNLLKQNYRLYSRDLLLMLESQGYSDLRPSFLEILIFLLSGEGSSIKKIGEACGLKKQTMTSHLNALEKRGYITRKNHSQDKRQHSVYFTDEGKKLHFILLNCTKELEKKYINTIGKHELERAQQVLNEMNIKLKDYGQASLPF